MAARNVLQRETFYFDTISTFQNLYFITFICVKKLSWYSYFHQSFSYTSNCISTSERKSVHFFQFCHEVSQHVTSQSKETLTLKTAPGEK